jgi:adenosylcobinamide-GDP ribazoletransferase
MSARAPHGDASTTPAGRALDGAALALAFLTVIPVRRHGEGGELGAAAAWFPLVGALVGGLAGAMRFCADPLLGAAVASILAVAVLVAVTGALHEDGLADCADGLGVHGDRERRLAVMRDPAIGVFGTLALLGWGLLLAAALAELSSGEALRALVSAAIVGRSAAILHAVVTPPARADGLGATFHVATPPAVVAGIATVAGCMLLDGLVAGLVATAAGTLVALATSAWSSTTLGGRTGDTLGATVALSEVAVCLTLLGFAAA